MTLDVLPGRLAVCRLEPGDAVPAWALSAEAPMAVTRTSEELSVICREEAVPDGVTRRAGWRALAVRGQLDFALTGVLASIATPLANGGVALLALATYDTDLVLVLESELERAIRALRESGHEVVA